MGELFKDLLYAFKQIAADTNNKELAAEVKRIEAEENASLLRR